MVRRDAAVVVERNGTVGVTLADAMAYHRAGYTVIPMYFNAAKSKNMPAREWKPFQIRRPTEGQIRAWFRGHVPAMGVVLGEASGGLVCRDFDAMEAYERWASEHPELAAMLPTVATRRGRHIYCRAAAKTVQRAWLHVGKSTGEGAVHLGDGEFRAGRGCYAVLPPSVHPSGVAYRWLGKWADRPPELEEIPLLDDLVAAGFCDRATQEGHKRDAEHSGELKRTQENPSNAGCCGVSILSFTEHSVKNLPDPWPAEIHLAIERTLPKRAGQRHRQVFELCRALQGIASVAEYDARDLKPIVRDWHRRALPHISTKPFEETWIDFLKGWPNVRFKSGDGTLRRAWEAAANADLPALALRFDEVRIQRLVALCRELQRAANGEPFFLSCRSVAQLLAVHHATASRWLYLLVAEDVLQPVNKGTLETMKASEFFYLGPLDENECLTHRKLTL
jgi:hypothetical protein